jgi:asparagine synthase (glutamine-hydrolysing)
VKTFSIDVPVNGYSEAKHARDVARAFSTDHHELTVEPGMVPGSIEAIGAIGEPFADSSAVPTRLVAQLARGHVTVALAGDGGDEAFGGYQRYADLQRLDRWRPAGRIIAARIPQRVRQRSPRVSEFARVMACSPHDRYAEWMTHFRLHQLGRICRPEFVEAAGGIRRAWDHVLALPEGEGINRYSRADTLTYLPGDLLVKVDRMSMAHSLEVRSPFLDHRLVEVAAALPSRLKLRHGVSKWILRKLALARGLPATAVNRPKMGFAVPVGLWMRHELREWVSDLLLSEQALARGYFVESELRRLVTDHLDGRDNHEVRVWNLAMLELWHRLWIDRSFEHRGTGSLQRDETGLSRR